MHFLISEFYWQVMLCTGLTIIERIGCQDADSSRQLEAYVQRASQMSRRHLGKIQRTSLQEEPVYIKPLMSPQDCSFIWAGTRLAITA